MNKEEKTMINIYCPKCNIPNTFINGKCNFCNKELIGCEEKSIIYTWIFTIICGVLAIYFWSKSKVFVSCIFALLAIFDYILIEVFKEDEKRLVKISQDNTSLEEEQKEQERLERKKMEERRLQLLEQEREEQEEQEKRRLQMLEQEKMEIFYKECSEKKLFKTKNADNRERILEIAEMLELKKDIEIEIKQMYYAERIKDIIFNNYAFLKPIKAMINRYGIYQFMCLTNKCDTAKEMDKIKGEYLENKVLSSKGTSNKVESQKILKYIAYYSKLMNDIEKDEELDKICKNLLKTYVDNEYIDYDYISKKAYDIYTNSYKEKHKKDITQSDFSNIFVLMKTKIDNEGKYSDFYTLISKEYKNIKYFPEKIYNELVHHKKNIKFYEDVGYCYIVDKKSELSFYEICKLLLDMDKMCAKYNKMVDKEKTKIKKQKIIENAKKKELKDKEIIEQERLRLLKGDISKEVELNDAIHQKKIKQKEIEIGYQNVQDGFEFEEYVANLYKELGYTIEQVTKKSGDQGADVVGFKDDTKYVIQAKFYNSPVGNKAVQEVVAAIGMYKADKGIVITNNSFTQSAIELAKANNIELVDRRKIEEYKKQILAKI